jgi:hypothetical protein
MGAPHSALHHRPSANARACRRWRQLLARYGSSIVIRVAHLERLIFWVASPTASSSNAVDGFLTAVASRHIHKNNTRYKKNAGERTGARIGERLLTPKYEGGEQLNAGCEVFGRRKRDRLEQEKNDAASIFGLRDGFRILLELL